ncbi:RdRP-domain-containing protein [Exidia glandulosa HHB12029]|uniref:RNA-dependent RNA polymerase n=1 Tax=Exidia glandulosa HHB12029 TaxID=1314781 RepID=A0A165MQJ3_EXIGL|nr:RdRP-domain-containing protein [Exidia glandulosa HHB12029]
MEIFFRNVPYSCTEYDLVDALARVLHGPEFLPYSLSGAPLNFHVNLRMKERSNRAGGDRMPGNAGNGHLTIPSLPAAQLFLERYGQRGIPLRPLSGPVRYRCVYFARSGNEPPPSLIAQLENEPWQNPRYLIEQQNRATEFAMAAMRVTTVQFGWCCRDGTFSIEWESRAWSDILFEDLQHQLVLKPASLGSRRPAIVMKYRHIGRISVSVPRAQECSILFELDVAPSFELEPQSPEIHILGMTLDLPLNRNARRTRMFYPDEELKRSAPYVSTADLHTFCRLADAAGLYSLEQVDYPCERRGRFSTEVLNILDDWLRGLPRAVAIQVERLLYERLLDAREMVGLSTSIARLIAAYNADNVAAILRTFGAELKSLPWYTDPQASPKVGHKDVSNLHVTVSPSSVSITGPIPDRSNRILRIPEFRGFEENFIRIAFADDDGQTFRYDPDVDTTDVVRSLVLPIMRDGFTLGGRLYKYLAYSQSALKQHSFWFVHSFHDAAGTRHSARTIRKRMGNFDKDKRCPARVGARMSLAFSATEQSVTTFIEHGFESSTLDGPTCMTDGAGVMSPDAADLLWRTLHEGRTTRLPPTPSVVQIRLAGAKGVLVVDPSVEGRRIGLRPSMLKFAADSRFNKVEVCKAFERPAVAFLNRPLIMILEARGIPKETFLDLQQHVIDRTRASTKSFIEAAALLEKNDLGSSFRIPSVFKALHTYTLNCPSAIPHLLAPGSFLGRMLAFSVHHVLRGLKRRGRIPVPHSWTLVGIPDHYGVLKEGEVFVCIRDRDGDPNVPSQARYIEGQVAVSRSPTCHPGDVMTMTAIGRPPPGTPLAAEPPINCVLFSTKGTRSPASCLGGGDYDGDEYVVMKLPQLLPPIAAAPAMYKNNPKQDIGRPYEMEDIYQFAANYIVNDQLGRIAVLWLRIADSSPRSVYDDKCMKLAELHSVAVDYAKTGIPVNHSEIPRAPPMIPDWHTNELGPTERDKIYPSQRALGFLYRAISLDDAHEQVQPSVAMPRTPLRISTATDRLANIDGHSPLATHPLVTPMENLISIRAPSALSDEDTNEHLSHIVSLLNQYCTDLRIICQHNTLARSRRAQLTEEEVVAGTIVARTNNYRRREDHMTRMNEQTERLGQRVRGELMGDEDEEAWVPVRRAWLAWRVSVIDGGFGSSSFGLLALGVMFDALKAIERDARR